MTHTKPLDSKKFMNAVNESRELDGLWTFTPNHEEADLIQTLYQNGIKETNLYQFFVFHSGPRRYLYSVLKSYLQQLDDFRESRTPRMNLPEQGFEEVASYWRQLKQDGWQLKWTLDTGSPQLLDLAKTKTVWIPVQPGIEAPALIFANQIMRIKIEHSLGLRQAEVNRWLENFIVARYEKAVREVPLLFRILFKLLRKNAILNLTQDAYSTLIYREIARELFKIYETAVISHEYLKNSLWDEALRNRTSKRPLEETLRSFGKGPPLPSPFYEYLDDVTFETIVSDLK